MADHKGCPKWVRYAVAFLVVVELAAILAGAGALLLLR